MGAERIYPMPRNEIDMVIVKGEAWRGSVVALKGKIILEPFTMSDSFASEQEMTDLVELVYQKIFLQTFYCEVYLSSSVAMIFQPTRIWNRIMLAQGCAYIEKSMGTKINI